MVGGDFTIEVLNEVPSSASRIPLPVTSTSDVLAQVGRAGGAVAKVAGAETVYRIVPSNEMAKGIAENSQRYANSTKGDASVLIKDACSTAEFPWTRGRWRRRALAVRRCSARSHGRQWRS